MPLELGCQELPEMIKTIGITLKNEVLWDKSVNNILYKHEREIIEYSIFEIYGPPNGIYGIGWYDVWGC